MPVRVSQHACPHTCEQVALTLTGWVTLGTVLNLSCVGVPPAYQCGVAGEAGLTNILAILCISQAPLQPCGRPDLRQGAGWHLFLRGSEAVKTLCIFIVSLSCLGDLEATCCTRHRTVP